MHLENSSKPTILVVDDILDNLHLLTRELTDRGFKVRGVLDGSMALLVANSTEIDLILLDIMLPDMDGYEVCRRLKDNTRTCNIPIIFLSALDESLDKVKAFSVGGVDYITKPFKIVEVIARIETQIALRQAQLKLQLFNQELEARVQQRTQELETINQSLADEIRVRQQIEEELRHSEVRYRLIAENMGDLICLHDISGNFLYVSPSAQTLIGYDPDDMHGQTLYDFCHPDDVEAIQLTFQGTITADKSLSSSYRMRCQSGQYLWVETLAKPLFDEGHHFTGIITSSRDITQRIEIENQLRHDSLHDALTNLPNRNWLSKRLELELLQCQRYGNCKFGLLMIDLDRFKAVNDSLGHLIGDQLLIRVAELLNSCVRDVDMVSRWGGDEFIVFLDKISDLKEAIHVAERIQEALKTPFTIEEKIIFTSASVGILINDNNYTNSNDIFRDVDIALYRAKESGRDRYEIFGSEMYQEAIEMLSLENDLRMAIQEQSFLVYYQPIFNLGAHQSDFIGFEALVRWQHPQRGLIMPDRFIDLAEDTGLINFIGEQVLQQVCAMIQQWEDEFRLAETFRVSVNVSSKQFRDTGFIQIIDQILGQTQVRPDRLKLEITERILLDQSERLMQILTEINRRGIQLSIDDFGTGYSSLKYLSQFSVNTLKIDRSFVSQIQSGQSSHSGIVQAIIDLAHNLQMDAVAEGVESAQQVQQLKNLGCEAAQGYFFSPPLPAAAATQFICDYFSAKSSV